MGSTDVVQRVYSRDFVAGAVTLGAISCRSKRRRELLRGCELDAFTPAVATQTTGGSPRLISRRPVGLFDSLLSPVQLVEATLVKRRINVYDSKLTLIILNKGAFQIG